MAANYQTMNTYNAPYQQIRDMLMDPTFCTFNKFSFKVESPTYEGYILYFKNGVNFSSWGEEIQINITQLPGDPSKSNVVIRSECALPTQIVDWGKNKENVNKVINYLQQRINCAPQGYTPSVAPQNYAPNPAPQYYAPPAPQQPVYNQAPPVQQNAYEAPKFCIKCGKPVTPDANFCMGCGNKLF